MRGLKQRVHVGLFHGAATVHHQHVICGAGNHAHVVGNHDASRASFALRNLDHVQDLGLDGHVEGGGWLVRDQYLRIIRNRNSNDHALAHTAGKLVGEGLQALLRLRNTHKVQKLSRAGECLGLGNVVVGLHSFHQLRTNVIHRRQGRQRVLEDHADLLAADARHGLVVLGQQLFAVVQHRAGDLGVIGQKAHHSHGSDRLTRAGLAHNAKGAAGVEVKVHAAHCGDNACLRREGNVEITNAKYRVGGIHGRCHARPPEFEFGSKASRRPSAMNAMETVNSVSTSAGK